MKNENPNYTWLKFAALAAGGYVLWSNREKIQEFLTAQGISLPIEKQLKVAGIAALKEASH